MRRCLGFVVLVVMGLLPALMARQGAAADEQAALAALRSGQFVALMRHAAAPGGVGDPPGMRLDDCATQRNLSEAGRRDARRLGLMIKGHRAAIGKILSSPWCRCLETARLLDLGGVEPAEAFSNAFVLAHERDRLTREARAIIASWRGPGTLLIVTHGANIAALVGINPAEGEIVVIRSDAGGTLSVVGRIVPPAG